MIVRREDTTPLNLADPTRLVFAAPSIDGDEDWRSRSLISWIILAGHEGIEAVETDEGGKGFLATWCGNVTIDGLIYRVHRAPRLRYRMLDVDDQGNAATQWILMAATYAEPVTTGVEVIDPRNDR